MEKMIQIRHVPEALHRRLKTRAVTANQSLSDYLLVELQKIATRPTLVELRARLAQREAVSSNETPTQALRRERDARE